MTITMKDIIDSMGEKNDIFHDAILLSLYDKYTQKEKYMNSKYHKNSVNLLKINSAYNNISTRIKNNKKYEYENERLSNNINNLYIILSNYISNFDKNNKEKTQNCIDLITILESLLKLPITFPENIENCLINEINKDKMILVENNKKKRKL